MKKLRCLPAVKGVAVLLLTACVIGVPCLSYLFIDSINQCQTVNEISDLWNYNYAESTEFSNDVNLRLTQLTEYLKLKKILETDGELDYNKVAAEIYLLNGREEYTVGELLKYNENNYGFYSDGLIQASALDRFSFASMIRSVYSIIESDSGSIEIGEAEGAEFIADFTKQENKVFLSLEEAGEYYKTLWELNTPEEDARHSVTPSQEDKKGEIAEFLDSISDKLGKEGTNTSEAAPDQASYLTTELSKEVKINLLADAAYCMTYYVAYYQYYHTIFEENSDFLYWISSPNQEICTNIEESDLGANPKEDFSGISPMGEIWYQTENYLMKATMPATQRARMQIAELEKLFLEDGGEKVSIHIAVPAKETNGLFCTRQESLERTYHNIPKYAGALIGTGILILLCICFLFYAAGHKAGVKGIYLNWFDRWYTEIAAGICISLGILCVMLAWDEFKMCIYSSELYFEDVVSASVFGFAAYIVALFSLASLTRRIKAGSLWKNSLTCRILSYMKRRAGHICVVMMQMWENRSVSKRIVFAYGGVVVGNFIVPIVLIILAEALDYREGGIALFCLLLLAAAFAVNMKILRRLVDRELELTEIYNGAERISAGELNYKLEETAFHGMMRRMAGAVNRIGDGLSRAIEQSIRDERMKTDLITNVSHDIKTPLTSIINYVDLLKREQFEDERVQSYLEVLDQKSQRLKNLIDDLIEASKLSSQTVILSIEKIDLVELVRQTNGEFAEKFASKNLTIMPTLPENPVFIEADGRRMWRVLENLYINVSKYAMENTRVYISVLEKNGNVEFSIKNISSNPLNIDASELTERFIRGDVSRSTEGSGLGLSIAKSLTELMHGTFEIYLDGDLFRVTIVFGVKEICGIKNAETEIVVGEAEQMPDSAAHP